MTDERLGGMALIVGTVGTIVTMILHPTGHDLFEPGELESATRMIVGAHSLAILSMPLLFLGALALSRHLAAANRLSIAALVVYGFALVAGMGAAVVSGFMAPGLAEEAIAADSPESETWLSLFHYNGMLNQAFARVLVVASSISILLWSAAIVRSRALALGMGIYGLILGPVTILAVGSGHLSLDVHGFGLVVLGQAVWFIGLGVLLCRLRAG